MRLKSIHMYICVLFNTGHAVCVIARGNRMGHNRRGSVVVVRERIIIERDRFDSQSVNARRIHLVRKGWHSPSIIFFKCKWLRLRV